MKYHQYLIVLIMAILGGAYCNGGVCPQKLNDKLAVHYDKSSNRCLSWHTLGQNLLFSNKYMQAMHVCHTEANGILHSFVTYESGKEHFHALPTEMYSLVQSMTGQQFLNGLRIVAVYKARESDESATVLFRHTNNSDVSFKFVKLGNQWQGGFFGLSESMLAKLFDEAALKFPLCLIVNIGDKEFEDATYQQCDKASFNMFICTAQPLTGCTIAGNRCVCKGGSTGRFCQLQVFYPKEEFKELSALTIALILIGVLLVALIFLCIAYQRKLKRDRLRQKMKIKKIIEEKRMLKRFDLVNSMASRIMSSRR